MQSCFSFARFSPLMSWTLRTHKSFLVNWTLRYFLAFLFIEGLISFLTSSFDQTALVTILGAMIYCYSVGKSCSLTVGEFCTRPTRLQIIMLPATNAEKYASRAVVCFVLMPLLVFAAFCVVDILRVIVGSIAGWTSFSSSAVGDFVRCVFLRPELVETPIAYARDANLYTDAFITAHTIMAITSWLFCPSLFVLGGAVFRRHQFVNTSVVLVFLWLTWNWFVGMIENVVGLLDAGETIIDAAFMPCLIAASYVVTILFVLLIVVNIWLAYRLFCRLQIIGQRWQKA